MVKPVNLPGVIWPRDEKKVTINIYLIWRAFIANRHMNSFLKMQSDKIISLHNDLRNFVVINSLDRIKSMFQILSTV